MQKKILILADYFYPYDNANTNCIYKVIRGLQQKDYEVSVVTTCYQKELPQQDTYRGCKVYRTYLTETATVDKLFYDHIDSRPLPIRLLFMVLGHIAHLYVEKLRLIRAKKLLRSLKSEKFVRVLSFLQPYDSHEFAYYFSRFGVKWVMYNLDAFVYNYSELEHLQKRKRTEIRWCKRAIGVINTYGLMQENEKQGYFPYKNLKQLEVALPNLEIPERINVVSTSTSDKVILRYTGMFYAHIRRPDVLLDILKKLDPEKFVAEFYGACCSYLRSNFSKLPACVQLMGSVSQEKCKQLLETADILINVGNLCPNQLPSKVFEYIASGKPILNLYSADYDTSIHYLNMCPNSMSVKTAANVSQADLEKLAASPRTSVEDIRTIFHDCLQENVIQQVTEFIDTI